MCFYDHVTKCCYCIPLRPGAFIVAFVKTISAAIHLTWALALADHLYDRAGNPIGSYPQPTEKKCCPINENNYVWKLYILYNTTAVIQAMHLISDLIMIGALIYKLPQILYPWMWLNRINILIMFSVFVSGFCVSVYHESSENAIFCVIYGVFYTFVEMVYPMVTISSQYRVWTSTVPPPYVHRDNDGNPIEYSK